MLNFDVQWLNYQSHEPRNAGVAVRGWRLFDLVVQVNKLTLTTFVPGATLGFPLKKTLEHVETMTKWNGC